MVAVVSAVPTMAYREVSHLMNTDLGQYEEFAQMVRAIVGERSLRAVQVRTGVGHTTILNMTKGLRPKATTIRLFAEGMGVDVNPLLEAAGYPPLPTQQYPEPKLGEDAAFHSKGAEAPATPSSDRSMYLAKIAQLSDQELKALILFLESRPRPGDQAKP